MSTACVTEHQIAAIAASVRRTSAGMTLKALHSYAKAHLGVSRLSMDVARLVRLEMRRQQRRRDARLCGFCGAKRRIGPPLIIPPSRFDLLLGGDLLEAAK